MPEGVPLDPFQPALRAAFLRSNHRSLNRPPVSGGVEDTRISAFPAKRKELPDACSFKGSSSIRRFFCTNIIKMFRSRSTSSHFRLKISSNRNPSSVNQNGVPVLRTCVEKRSTGKRRSVGDCGISEDRRS